MSRLTLLATTPDEFTIKSDLLGDLAIRTTDVITFTNGLLGFPETRRFALLRGSSEGLFWLQSLDHSALVFLLVDPFTVVSDYSVEVPAAYLADLGQATAADVMLLAIVTLPGTPADMPTVNLQGPLIINLAQRTAKQGVFSDVDHGVRHPVDLAQLVA
jgi:flagellar assembly factor FliW